jgi:5-formyltetrahydrofolate cyclo-ligase
LRLFDEPVWRDARCIKVNPDSPQLHVREAALARGIRVYVPTPRLKGGFNLLDPDAIPADKFHEAAALKSMPAWSVAVALEDMPQLDAIVTGCAAVTAGGKRAGKGEGYSDLEYAILRELGFDAVPVATTVHDVQVVTDFPIEDNDIPLSVICTPTRTLRVETPPPAPTSARTTCRPCQCSTTCARCSAAAPTAPRGRGREDFPGLPHTDLGAPGVGTAAGPRDGGGPGGCA